MSTLKPVLPSYEEAALQPESQGTSRVYSLKVFIELPRIYGSYNLVDYNPRMPLGLVFYGIPLGANLRPKKNGSVKQNADFRVPDRKLVTIVYESPEYDELVKIRKRMLYSGPSSNDICQRFVLAFCSSTIKAFKYDETKETYFMKISVENTTFLGSRELQMAKRSELGLAYTLQVEYAQAVLEHPEDECYFVRPLNPPVSMTIMRKQKVIDHELLSNPEGNPAFTVIFKASSMKEIERVRSYLTTPRAGDVPGDLKLTRNMRFRTQYKVPKKQQECSPEKPLKLDFTPYVPIFGTRMYFNCYSHNSRCNYMMHKYT